MNKTQEMEWLEAQKISIGQDLVAVAKQQLLFLESVDRIRSLYHGPLLEIAIRRYKKCWLPLLAMHNKSQLMIGYLVVPLDCEWVWHCHRLNPVQYKADCEEFFGMILDNRGVQSTVKSSSSDKQETARLWSSLYPEEQYELDFYFYSQESDAKTDSGAVLPITYDLVSAVKRQSSFTYQVARPWMNDDRFLEEAAARYRGFLHLIKRNKEKSIRRFCVPTYDIDLIWHSHQLQPACYNKDLVKVLGRVLEHDDTDSDRSKGKKLDVGFSGITKKWEETFGRRYWRAGAMHRGDAPSPVADHPMLSSPLNERVSCVDEKFIDLPCIKTIQVLLEIVKVNNFVAERKGSLFVKCSKKEPDLFFNIQKKINIESEVRQKHIVVFQCEPNGELVFELVSCISSNLPFSKNLKTVGTTIVPLQDLVNSSTLSLEKWFKLDADGDAFAMHDPVCLHIALSATVPLPSPYFFHMVHSHQSALNSCINPLLGKIQPLKLWSRFLDDKGNEIICIQMRNLKKVTDNPALQIVGVSGCSGEEKVLATFMGKENNFTKWLLMDNEWCLQLEKRKGGPDYIVELQGHRLVKLFSGRRLDFEIEHYNKQIPDGDFITLVEFSSENPYGKALALFDLKSGFLKINHEWFVLPGILLAFILSDTMKKEGSRAVFSSEITNYGMLGTLAPAEATDTEQCEALSGVPLKGSTNIVNKSGGCGGCGSECSDEIGGGRCGGCGAGCGGSCGGQCGMKLETADIGTRESGSKCGGGRCGGGRCSGGCGNGGTVESGMATNSKCGGGCGGSCGGGCGGCGGGYVSASRSSGAPTSGTSA